MKARLKRSRTNKMISGVCGGIAEYLGWDATVVRLIFVVLTFFSWGAPILLYFILALVMPE